MTKFVSFARNMEDVILRRALKDVDSGFYIDIGAGDPSYSSATRAFYNAGWQGINVDVEMRNVERLARRSRDVSLLAEPNSASAAVRPIGSTANSLGSDLRAYLAPGRDVHFLRIDADRIGQAFLEASGWSAFRPWIVILSSGAQAVTPEALEPSVVAAGYKPVYSDGFNRMFLARDKAHLENLFATSPNAADDFVTCRERRLETELFRLQSEVAAASTSKKEVVRLYGKLLEKPNTDLSTLPQDTFHQQPLLRRLNPERIIRRAIRRRFPKKPPIGTLGKADASGLHMLPIELEDLTLNFATDALNDERGVGRVAKEQFKELQKRQISLLPQDKAKMATRPAVNFFPSIHWCPKVLPPNSVLMIHDVIPLVLPHVFPDHIVREWLYKFATIAQSASHIVTISNSSAADISAVLDIPRERISVIHNGVDISGWQDESMSKIALPPEPYFVCIGSRDYHKNLEVVYQAICLPEAQDCRLLVVGNGFKEKEQKDNPAIRERVRFLGRLSDPDLAHVLKGARALLFPSIYEGFGLPPLEAALLGVPTIASARPAMTEILTQGVQFCQPHAPREWAMAMRSFAERKPDPHAAECLKRHVAEHFNWCISVDELLEVFKGVHPSREGEQARS